MDLTAEELEAARMTAAGAPTLALCLLRAYSSLAYQPTPYSPAVLDALDHVNVAGWRAGRIAYQIATDGYPSSGDAVDFAARMLQVPSHLTEDVRHATMRSAIAVTAMNACRAIGTVTLDLTDAEQVSLEALASSTGALGRVPVEATARALDGAIAAFAAAIGPVASPEARAVLDAALAGMEGTRASLNQALVREQEPLAVANERVEARRRRVKVHRQELRAIAERNRAEYLAERAAGTQRRGRWSFW